jgi:hypothetical protein
MSVGLKQISDIRILDGFNDGWIEFANGEAGAQTGAQAFLNGSTNQIRIGVRYPNCQHFAFAKRYRSLAGERSDLLTSVPVRSLEHNEIRIVGERSGEGQGVACIPSIDHLTG